MVRGAAAGAGRLRAGALGPWAMSRSRMMMIAARPAAPRPAMMPSVISRMVRMWTITVQVAAMAKTPAMIAAGRSGPLLLGGQWAEHRGMVRSSWNGGWLRAGFGLVLELSGGPVGAAGEGEGEPAGLAGLAGAHAAGSGQRVDDRQAAAALGLRAGFGALGHGRGAVGDFAGD